MSEISNFICEHLHPVVKAHQRTKYMDYLGITNNNASDLISNFRVVFICIPKAGLKQAIEKYRFGVKQNGFLGETFSSERTFLQAHNVQYFLSKLRFPKSEKVLQCYLGFVNHYENETPRMTEKFNASYELLKTDSLNNITTELDELFDSINKALSIACWLSIKQTTQENNLSL